MAGALSLGWRAQETPTTLEPAQSVQLQSPWSCRAQETGSYFDTDGDDPLLAVDEVKRLGTTLCAEAGLSFPAAPRRAIVADDEGAPGDESPEASPGTVASDESPEASPGAVSSCEVRAGLMLMVFAAPVMMEAERLRPKAALSPILEVSSCALRPAHATPSLTTCTGSVATRLSSIGGAGGAGFDATAAANTVSCSRMADICSPSERSCLSTLDSNCSSRLSTLDPNDSRRVYASVLMCIGALGGAIGLGFAVEDK